MSDTLAVIPENGSTESPIVNLIVELNGELPLIDTLEARRNGSTVGIEASRVYDDNAHKYLIRDTSTEEGDRTYHIDLKHQGTEIAVRATHCTKTPNLDECFIIGGVYKTPYMSPLIINKIKQTGIQEPSEAEPNHLAVLLTYPPTNLNTSEPGSHLWRLTITNTNILVPLLIHVKVDMKGMSYTYARIGRLGSPADDAPAPYAGSGLIDGSGKVTEIWYAALNISDTTFTGDNSGAAQAILASMSNTGVAIVIRPSGDWTMDVVFPPWVPTVELPLVPQPVVEVKTYDDTDIVKETKTSTATHYGEP